MLLTGRFQRSLRTAALRCAVALLALPALLGLSAVVAAPASADVPAFAAAVNVTRAQRGLAPLALAGDLSAVAQRWSQQMAASGRLEHNPALTTEVSGWRRIGENVGYGGSELAVHNALLASAPHLANIVNREYTQIGIGIASGGGRVWVTQVFRQPPAGSGQQPASFLKAGHSPTVHLVTGSAHRPATYAEWAAAGFPAPSATNTWYVRYPWSASISAVTFWADGWQWERLDYAAWAAAGHPSPRTAGWIGGSTIWKRADAPALYLSDPSGQTHQLSYAEWAATEFRRPELR